MAQGYFNFVCDKNKYIADSCGIYADGVSETSENALIALKEKGVDFNHISQPLNEELLEKSDYIIGITQNHAQTIANMFPSHTEKIFSFPIDIPDPYGGTKQQYIDCLEQIIKGIDKIIDYLKSDE